MVYGNRLSMLSTKWCGRAKRESRRQKNISNNDELVWFHGVAVALARATGFIYPKSRSGRNAAPCQALSNRLLAMSVVVVEADGKLKKFNMNKPLVDKRMTFKDPG